MDDSLAFGHEFNQYKGDGVNTCKWCGDTGWMHTFSNDGRTYSDTPCCACELGTKILKEQLRKEQEEKHG